MVVLAPFKGGSDFKQFIACWQLDHLSLAWAGGLGRPLLQPLQVLVDG
jgi:hypothetical protein